MIEFKEKKRGIQFKINTATHMIPSAEFPLSGKKVYYINANNTEICEDQELLNIFNSTEYRNGMCYSNAETFRQNLLNNGIEESRIKYLSGWIFSGDTYPVHHAIILVDDKYIFDFIPNNDLIFKALDEIANKNPDKKFKKEETEVLFRDIVLELRKGNNSDWMVAGKSSIINIYIMSEDNMTNAKKIFQSIEKNFPNHPSYKTMNRDKSGQTKIQKDLGV